MGAFPAVMVRELLVSLRAGFPKHCKVRPSSCRSLRVLGWLGLEGALELLPTPPSSPACPEEQVPKF